jgi:hypothetical protein
MHTCLLRMLSSDLFRARYRHACTIIFSSYVSTQEVQPRIGLDTDATLRKYMHYILYTHYVHAYMFHVSTQEVQPRIRSDVDATWRKYMHLYTCITYMHVLCSVVPHDVYANASSHTDLHTHTHKTHNYMHTEAHRVSTYIDIRNDGSAQIRKPMRFLHSELGSHIHENAKLLPLEK